MKQLRFSIANNLSALHDEILAAVPSTRPVVNGQGENVAVMLVQAKGNDISLTVPDDVDEAAIQAVVDAHDASVVQRDLKAEARATGATKLKALGLTDGEIAALQG